MTKKKKIIIIGAGPGGLSAGMLLAHEGYEVEIFEKEKINGGRNGFFQLGDYKFDIGPTFLMMEYILREIFTQTRRKLDDYLKLTKLSPMYRLMFRDKELEVFDDDEKMMSELVRVFPGEEKGLLKFNQREAWRLAKLFPILSRDNNNIFDALHPRFLAALPAFALGRSLFQELGQYFKQTDARLCFTFQSKYLGMSPWACPGAFAMVPYVEQQFGIYHVEGGLSQISVAMAKALVEDGGLIHYVAKVKEIIIEKGQAKGVRLEDGRECLAEAVIMNADFAYGMSNLITPKVLKKYTPERLAKKKYSCSTFMLYLGLKKEYKLNHHTIIFAKDYKQNVDDIFAGRLTDKDFSIYVQNAGVSDKTLAPAGHSTFYVLVPVPNNQSGLDWAKLAPIVREQALDILEERLGLSDLRKMIEVEKVVTPADWESDLNVKYGAVFNLGHQLNQMLWFRPHNRFEEIENLFLVGGGTHPGSGLPTIYESGRIVANLIKKMK